RRATSANKCRERDYASQAPGYSVIRIRARTTPSVIFLPRAINPQSGAIPAEIPFNCDRHHGTIGLGSHYLQHGLGSPKSKAFVPGLEMAQRGVQDPEAVVADALRFVTTNYEEASTLA